MKLFKIVVFTFLLTFGFTQSNACDCHPVKVVKISEDKIKEKAKIYLTQMVEDKDVEKTWLKSSIIASEKKIFFVDEEWLISFRNSEIKDENKKIIYIYLTQEGKITGANYTGN